MTNKEISIQYAYDVLNNTIPSCIYVKQSAQRFLDDLSNDKYYYDDSKVNEVIGFLNALELTNMPTKTNFYLSDWQTFIISNVYGIIQVKNNLRKYKKMYLEIPRKNGKSFLINGLAMYHLIMELDSEIVVSANSREQVKNVDFKLIKILCNQLDAKKKKLKSYYNHIKYNNNSLFVTASDAKKLDGLNCSVVIVDELHEAKDSSMYDVLKSSQGQRIEPLILVITTAGFSTDSFCYEMRNYCTTILSGAVEDSTQFSIIYTLDVDEDYTTDEAMQKANPNLNISVVPDFIRGEVQTGINNPIESHSVKVKYFNLWLNNKTVEQVYIENEVIEKIMKPLDFPTNQNIFVGLDLGSTSDLTSISYMWIDDYQIYIKNKYYLPENSISTNVNKNKYKQWCTDNFITLTAGNVTDYDYILADIQNVGKNNNICQVSYDSWNATQFAINATNEGFFLVPYSQSNSSINRPTKELLRLALNGTIILDSNPVTKWCFGNVVIKENNAGNLRPEKTKYTNKIDGVYGILTCLGGYLSCPQYSGVGVY